MTGSSQSPSVKDVLSRNIIFVSGKGGVGKTMVSRAISLALAEAGRRTLWITFEDPVLPPGDLRQIAPQCFHLNAVASTAFEEYATLKIGASALSRLFLKNKLVQYLAQAAPGIHELVLMGKLWHERNHYDHVVADLPSTGHGLAMFQSTRNFSVLFQGGPIHRDAVALMETFGNPMQCGQLLVALPEEMPLREALELNGLLREIFPDNHPGFLVNRLFPNLSPSSPASSEWRAPIATTAAEYVTRRTLLEQHNLRLWREADIDFGQLPFVAPQADVSKELAHALLERGYVA